MMINDDGDEEEISIHNQSSTQEVPINASLIEEGLRSRTHSPGGDTLTGNQNTRG